MVSAQPMQGGCEPPGKSELNLWPNEVKRWECQFQRMYVFWFYNNIWRGEGSYHDKFNRVQRRGQGRRKVRVVFATLSSSRSLHLSLHAIKSNDRQVSGKYCASQYFSVQQLSICKLSTTPLEEE